jgi:hypothetical protein
MAHWIWKRLSDVALVHWIWGFGGGAVTSAILRAFTPLAGPWIALLGIGVLLLVIGSALTLKARRAIPPAPPVALLGRRDRIAYRMKGGSHKIRGGTIRNQDVAFDTDGTDLDHEDIDIR